MATNFPTSVDSFTDPTSGSAMNSPSHAAQHANANDAIEAIETALGTTGSWNFLKATAGVETTSITGTHSTPAISPQFAIGNYLLTGNTTITIPSPVAGQSFEIFVTQGGSGGYAVAYAGGSITWLPSTPVPNNTLGEIDQYMFTALTSSTWIGEWVTSNPTVASSPLLARLVFLAAGSGTTYTTTSSTPTAIDATNLTISFTAPASGDVLGKLSAVTGAHQAGNTVAMWALLDHTTHAQRGNSTIGSLGYSQTSGPLQVPVAAPPILITGLTPSTIYQVDWAFASANNSDPIELYAYNTASNPFPAVMEVWAA
jgi:hypothetical protein